MLIIGLSRSKSLYCVNAPAEQWLNAQYSKVSSRFGDLNLIPSNALTLPRFSRVLYQWHVDRSEKENKQSPDDTQVQTPSDLVKLTYISIACSQ